MSSTIELSAASTWPQPTPLIKAIGKKGRTAFSLPKNEFENSPELKAVPSNLARKTNLDLPECSELMLLDTSLAFHS